MSEKKEKIEEIEEESDLEETIEEAEAEENKIDENKFTEFFEVQEVKAPVLEQVQIAPQSRITDLESSAFESGPIDNSKKEDDGFTYSVGANQQEEAKYIEDPRIESRNVVQGVSPVNMMEWGKNNLFEKPKISFAPSDDRGFQSSTIEKYTSPKKFDLEQSKKEDMFNTEVKYKPTG